MTDIEKNNGNKTKVSQKKMLQDLIMEKKQSKNTFGQANNQVAYQKNQKSLKQFKKHK